jgi:hypothetical protein
MTAAAIVTLVVAARLLPETVRRRSGEPISLYALVRGFGVVLRHRGFVVYLGILTLSYAGCSPGYPAPPLSCKASTVSHLSRSVQLSRWVRLVIWRGRWWPRGW